MGGHTSGWRVYSITATGTSWMWDISFCTSMRWYDWLESSCLQYNYLANFLYYAGQFCSRYVFWQIKSWHTIPSPSTAWTRFARAKGSEDQVGHSERPFGCDLLTLMFSIQSWRSDFVLQNPDTFVIRQNLQETSFSYGCDNWWTSHSQVICRMTEYLVETRAWFVPSVVAPNTCKLDNFSKEKWLWAPPLDDHGCTQWSLSLSFLLHYSVEHTKRINDFVERRGV